MSLFETQLRFLTVCKVRVGFGNGKSGLEDSFLAIRNTGKLATKAFVALNPFSESKNVGKTQKLSLDDSYQKQWEEYLLILTCDHIVLLKPSSGDQDQRNSTIDSVSPSISKSSLESTYDEDQKIQSRQKSNSKIHDGNVILYVPLSQITHLDQTSERIVCLSFLSNWMTSHIFPSLGSFPSRLRSLGMSESHKKYEEGRTRRNSRKKMQSKSSAASMSTSLSQTLSEEEGANDSKKSSTFPEEILRDGALSFLPNSRRKKMWWRDDVAEEQTNSETISLELESELEAQQLLEAVGSALRRLVDAVLWLDKGVDLNRNVDVSVVSLEYHYPLKSSLCDKKFTQFNYVLCRAPTWGDTVQIDLDAFPKPSFCDGFWVHFDITSPLGHMHGKVKDSDLCFAFDKCHGRLKVQALLIEKKGRTNGSGDVEASSCNLGFPDHVSEVGKMSQTVAHTRYSVELTCSVKATRGHLSTTNTGLLGYGCDKPENKLLKLTYPLTLVLGAVWFLALLVPTSSSLSLLDSFLGTAMIMSFSLHIIILNQKTKQNGNILVEKKYTHFVVDLVSAKLVEEPLVIRGDNVATSEDIKPQTTMTKALSRMISFDPTQTKGRMAEKEEDGGVASVSRNRVVDIGAPTFRRIISTANIEVLEHDMRRKSTTFECSLYSLEESETLDDVERNMLHDLQQRSKATKYMFPFYINACKGDVEMALERLQTTVNWRCEHQIDDVLQSPIPSFFKIKEYYEHGIIGRDRLGRPIILESIGRFKSAMAEFRKMKITTEDIIHQFVFFMEFIANEITCQKPPPDGQFIRIYDFQGLGLFDISDKESVAVGRLLMHCLEAHYPERMAKALIVNAPGFFPTIWKVIRPMLDPHTAEKISISSNQKTTLHEMREIMIDEVIPSRYGGLNEQPFSNGDQERLVKLAEELNQTKSHIA